MGSTIKKISKAKTSLNALNAKMKNFSKYSGDFNVAYKSMMQGDGTDAFWQGQKAMEWYEYCRTSVLDALINHYEHSYTVMKSYGKSVEIAEKKDKGGFTAKQMKLISDGLNGSSFMTGLPLNREDLRVSALPATVKVDSTADARNEQAKNCYVDIKASLANIVTCFEDMKLIWTDLKSNSTGDLATRANKRINALEKRKKKVNDCLAFLDKWYIADLLFSVPSSPSVDDSE